MRLLPLLLTSVSLCAPLAQARFGGTSSSFFHSKYYVLDNLLVTPESHPGLFSFTGRWLHSPTAHPHTPAYHATLWPGNSATVLIHGLKASIKLLPKPQGFVTNYKFYISIDGGEDLRYDLPAFDTDSLEENGGYYVNIDIQQHIDMASGNVGISKRDNDGMESGRRRGLAPHTIRITSVPDTPFSFEGLLVENTQIRQGNEWLSKQDQRVNIEFVGEGIDAEREGGLFLDQLIGGGRRRISEPEENDDTDGDGLHTSVQWQIAEKLGVRHSHISSGTCLLSSCSLENPLPGLEEQYFNVSPLNHTLNPPQPISKHDPRHPENLETPYRFPTLTGSSRIPGPSATFVVVDLGVSDLLLHSQEPESYRHALSIFLAKIRFQAHPKAKILVAARIGNPPADTVIPDTHQTRTLRKTLYEITKEVVATLRTEENDTDLYLLPITSGSPSSTPERDFLRGLCPFLLPPPSVLTSITAKTSLSSFTQSVPLSTAQKVCLNLDDDDLYRQKANNVFWTCLLLGLAGIMLYVAKTTVVGALAAIFGRRVLGMEEETIDLESALVEEEARGGMGTFAKLHRKPGGNYEKIG